MYNTQQLLDKIKLILKKSETGKDEARKRGEFFNIFNVLGLNTDETRTHSAFLAELLNPEGSHGLGDQFLQAFLNTVDCLSSWTFDTPSARVGTERSIGHITDDGSPAMGTESFYDADKSIPVYVPAESIEAYQNSKWGEFFSNIQPM